MRSKLAVIGLSTLAVFAIACGVGSGKTEGSVDGEPQGGVTGDQPEGPVTAAIGQTVTLTSTFLDDTTSVEVTLANPQQVTDADFLGPKNGMYYVVNVTVVATAGTYTSNPGAFKFVAADGTVYDWTITGRFDPTLSFTELNAGQRTAGNIVFDVPPAAIAGAKIQLDGIGLDFDEPAAYWSL